MEAIDHELVNALNVIKTRLYKAVDRYNAPLRIVIDSRGPEYIHIAYGVDRQKWHISEINQIGQSNNHE